MTAVPENIHWGYLDAALKPIRTVESGDTVVLNTLPAALKEDLPPDASWLTTDHKEALAEVPLGGPPGLFVNGPVGPHMLTGPIYVNGAMPGDVLQVDILEAKPKQDWGFSAILPNLGTLPDEFTIDTKEAIQKLIEVPVRDTVHGVLKWTWIHFLGLWLSHLQVNGVRWARRAKSVWRQYG